MPTSTRNGEMITPAKQPKIKYCPFCGEIEQKNLRFKLLGIMGYQIECTQCEAEGPHAESKVEAIEKWNKRSDDNNAKGLEIVSKQLVYKIFSVSYLKGRYEELTKRKITEDVIKKAFKKSGIK